MIKMIMGWVDLQEIIKNQAETIEKQAKIIKEQAETIEKQAETIKKLEARIIELENGMAHLKKDSSNSSKPSSSDIVKPKTVAQKKSNGKKMKIGGQPHHNKHERVPFSAEQVDEIIEITLSECPECGGPLESENKATKITQQIEIVEKPYIIKEYHQHTYYCPYCQKEHKAPMPGEGKSGLFSVQIIAIIAYLKGRCHLSFSALKDLFQDVLQITISRGFLAKQIKKASAALKQAYEQVKGELPGAKHLHIDETGWKENGQKRWIWAFRANKYAFFVIKDTRATIVLEEILGLDFRGIISCDFYAAYRKFFRTTPALLQFCWAHLIRELRFLLKIPDAAVVRYGRRILKQVKLMFETIHKKGEMNEIGWKQMMYAHKEMILKRTFGTIPANNDAILIANRLYDWEDQYFGFIDSGIEPTNNVAELTVRQSVLDRIVTQGSRGECGYEWHERFWTVFTTCGLQNIPVMDFLKKSISSFFSLTSCSVSLISDN
jgi:transposase